MKVIIYGFNRDLGEVAAAKYRALASVCAQIRRDVSGDTFIGRALSLGPVHNPARVDALIAQYMRREINDVAGIALARQLYLCATGDELPAEHDPANAGDQANQPENQPANAFPNA